MTLITPMLKQPLNLMKSLFGATLFACLLALGTQAADTRLAVVNLKTVFDGYWKTKQSDGTIKERQNDFEKERKRMVEDYQKSTEEYRKLSEAAADMAVSGDERDKRKKTADSKLLEVREIEQNIRQYDSNFRTQITDQIKRMRENILREIREVVSAKAKAGSYNLILDTAAESANQTPIVVYASGLPDLTEEILTELNVKAPPEALKPDAGKTGADEKSDEKK